MRPFVTALRRASVPALLVAAGIALAPAAGAHNPPPVPTPAPTPTRDDVVGLPDGPVRTIVLVVGAATVLALIPLLVRRLRDTKDD